MSKNLTQAGSHSKQLSVRTVLLFFPWILKAVAVGGKSMLLQPLSEVQKPSEHSVFQLYRRVEESLA